MVNICRKCGKVYYYDVGKCIFCKSETEKKDAKSLKVISSTEVLIPSTKHKAPYFDIVVEDNLGNLHIKKSLKDYRAGDKFEPDKKKQQMNIKVGVIGTGATGVGIAETCLMNGFEVTLVSRTEERIKNITEEIERFLLKFMSVEEKNKIMKNYTPSSDINDLKDTGLIIESVLEDKKIKDDHFKRIDSVNDKAVIATNTSSLSIDELSRNLRVPSRMIGLHFFNPVTRMELVEVVKGKESTDKAVNLGVEFAKAVGKVPVVTKDSPSFIVNRILMPYLNEAAIIYEQGISSKEDIDKAAKLGLNHPMGPLALMDLIGLDVFKEIMDNLRKATGNDKYETAGIVKRMVKEGKLGRKTGQGFYDYD